MSVSANNSRVGDYELIDKLGEGAMGAVYKARQVSLDRIVALKILPRRFAADPAFVDRFLREARATAKLNHPNIVAGIDVGSADGYHYFAMEFIDGAPLGSRLRKSALPEKEVLRIGAAIAAALVHAHAAGIIHRDVKPDNILLDRDGTPKLADLGLAKAGAETDSSLTQAGTTVGTPHYIAPEQAAGKLDADGRADIYSLGCTLYHAATGKTPFNAPTPAVMMVKHLKDKMPHPLSIRPQLSAQFCAILERMVVRDPRYRYPDMKTVGRDLELLAAGSSPRNATLDPARTNFLPPPESEEVEAEPEPEPVRNSRPSVQVARRLRRSARKSTMLPTIAGIGAILLIGTAAWLFHMESAIQEQDAAAKQAEAQNSAHQKSPRVPAGESMPHTEGDFQAKPAKPQVKAPAPPPSDVVRPAPVAVQAPAEPPPQAVPMAPQRGPFTPLFSTDSTDGWRTRAPNWSMKNGVLSAQGVDGNAILERQQCLPANFELVMEATCANSFHFGWLSESATNFVMKTPQGRLQLSVFHTSDEELAHCDLKNPSDAHTYRVEVKGTSIRVYVDGALSLSSDQGEPANGNRRGMSMYVGRIAPATFRNIAVRELGQFSNVVSTGSDELDRVVQKLRELNPNFDGQVMQKCDSNGAVTELVFNTDGMTDLSALHGLPSLKVLRATSHSYRSTLSDISSLHGLPLTCLDLTGCKITDLTPLSGMPLQKLNIAHTQVASLAPLKGMQLETLEFPSTPVTDLSPLRDMALKALNINSTKVVDLSPLRGTQLMQLNCGWTAVKDISTLANFGRLTDLNLMGLKAIDISALRNLPLNRIMLEYKPDLHSKILREMKTLAIINGKGVAEFFGTGAP